jgi:membrane protease YdiL (CAAX protease family)
MTRETTSLVAANSAREQWRAYRTFIRRPVLPPKASGICPDALVATLRLFALDMLLMGAIILLAILAIAAGFVPPGNAVADLQWDMQTILLVVLAAPLMEEVAFRSWLSGRPGHVLALALLGGGAIAAAMLGVTRTGNAASHGVALAMGAALILALAALVLLRARPALGWFRRIFPGLYWLSTLAFALVHLANYTEGSLAILLPLVIPQFISGSIFGYARVHFGLWSAVLLHMLHNGMIVLVIVSASQATTG